MWPFFVGIGFTIFGLLLVVLKSTVRFSLVFFTIGLFFFLLWVFVILRVAYKRKIQKPGLEKCVCQICNHYDALICINKKCPCCISQTGDHLYL